MAHQLTTLLRRAGLGHRAPHVVAPASTPSSSSVVQDTADRARALLPARDRARYDERAAHVGPDGADVLRRTLATTLSVAAVAEMADVWEQLTPADRAVVHDPVRRLARSGRQGDTTTCGSAVLTMLAAAGDPALALWLGTGRLTRTGTPPELAGAPAARLAALGEASVEERFAPLHRVVKRRTNAGALLGLPWPGSLGTPPWGAAREARFVGLGFDHEMLDDTDAEHLTRVLDAVDRAVRRGVPVPLYSGGDTARGLATALPRHLVLAVGADEAHLTLWEPGEGRLVEVTRAELQDPPGPLTALGRWNHLTWAVLPVL